MFEKSFEFEKVIVVETYNKRIDKVGVEFSHDFKCKSLAFLVLFFVEL